MLRKLFWALILAPTLAMGMPPLPNDGGTGGGTGGTVTLPSYSITTAPGYPWGPVPTMPTNALLEGQSLGMNQSLVSRNGIYRMTLQTDGNLVIYWYATPIWDSRTSGYYLGNNGRLTMQSDGNLVIYDTNGYAYWDTHNTYFTPPLPRAGNYLLLQDDGNLVIYTRYGEDPALFQSMYNMSLAVWDSHYSQGNRH